MPQSDQIIVIYHDGDVYEKVITVSKNVFYYKNQEPHREDGPAIEYNDGNKHWYINGIRHRTDGPAIEYYDGTKEYYVNGKLHREDGPAYINQEIESYWFNGKYIKASSTEEFLRKIKLIIFW